MTTKLKEEHFQPGVIANLVVRATIVSVTPTDASWVALGSNLTANTVGYIELQGGPFSDFDKVSLDLEYIASSVQTANVNVLRASLPNTIPAGTYDVYIIKPNGRYAAKTAGLTYE